MQIELSFFLFSAEVECACACVCISLYACVYVCEYICVCVCLCVCTYVFALACLAFDQQCFFYIIPLQVPTTISLSLSLSLFLFQVLILRNHGLVALGETVEEAFHYLFNLVKACETQVAAISAGLDVSRLLVPSRQVQQQVLSTVTRGGGGVSSGRWGVGELEFEAYVRMLDRMVSKCGVWGWGWGWGEYRGGIGSQMFGSWSLKYLYECWKIDWWVHVGGRGGGGGGGGGWQVVGLVHNYSTVSESWNSKHRCALWIDKLKAGPPPLDLSFWSFLTFLHHGIEEVERHLFVEISLKNSKEKLVKWATEVARLHRVSIQSCTQNRPSLKIQSRSGDWI